MKKLLIIILLLFSIGVNVFPTQQKEIGIAGSILGANADPVFWSDFSCLNRDGTLDIIKYSEYMRTFANWGANLTRELPFLIVDKKAKESIKEPIRNFLPFMWEKNKYNLEKFNSIFFNNIKEMIKIANRHNLVFQLAIFDRCHGLLQASPWMLNHQNIKGWYDWNIYAARYVNKLLNTIDLARNELKKENINLQINLELENEPINKGFCTSGIETLLLLKKRGYENNQIELGVEYIKNEIKYHGEKKELIRTPLFEDFKRALRKAKLYGISNIEKREYLSTVHDLGNNQKKINELLKATQHTRRFKVSNDGQKPKQGSSWWRNITHSFFTELKLKVRKYKWIFEAVYRGNLGGYSKLGDDITGVVGIVESYKRIFKKFPINYKKFPKIILPPNFCTDEKEYVTCWDGSKILIKECINGKMVKTANKCPKEPQIIDKNKPDNLKWKFIKFNKRFPFIHMDFKGLIKRILNREVKIDISIKDYKLA